MDDLHATETLIEVYAAIYVLYVQCQVSQSGKMHSKGPQLSVSNSGIAAGRLVGRGKGVVTPPDMS